jgi:hypothetical protein
VGLRGAVGFERQVWMNAALAAFVVSVLVTLLLSLTRRVVRDSPSS